MYKIGQQIGEYTLVNFLGKGATAEVWSGDNGKGIYALKIFGFGVILDELAKAELQSEYTKTKDFDHPNIIKSLKFFVHNGTSVMVQELGEESLWKIYLSRCTLRDEHYGIVNENTVEHELNLFSEKELAQIIKDISSAMIYLNAEGVVHDDIKPGNFVSRKEKNGDRYYSLIDFGISRNVRDTIVRLTQTNVNSNAAFSTLYAAPEKHAKHESSVEGDVFSLGVSIMDLTNRVTNPPGIALNIGKDLDVVNGNYSFLFKKLIEAMLCHSSSSRIQIEKINEYASHYISHGHWPVELKDFKCIAPLVSEPPPVFSEQIKTPKSDNSSFFKWVMLLLLGILLYFGFSFFLGINESEVSKCDDLEFFDGYACYSEEVNGETKWGVKDENCSIKVAPKYCFCVPNSDAFLLKCNEHDKYYFSTK